MGHRRRGPDLVSELLRAGDIGGNRCSAKKSTKTLTLGARYRLVGHTARNMPEWSIYSPSTIAKDPLATCCRIAKSGTHVMPTPCSAKATNASTVVATAVMGKATSTAASDFANGQRWILPEVGYL